MTRRTDPRAGKQKRLLAQRMARVFLAAGPLGPGLQGENAGALVRPMIETVSRQFPEATISDFEAMLKAIGGMKDRGPSWQRVAHAALFACLEQLATEVLEQEVRDGKSVREVDRASGEVFYRRLR